MAGPLKKIAEKASSLARNYYLKGVLLRQAIKSKSKRRKTLFKAVGEKNQKALLKSAISAKHPLVYLHSSRVRDYSRGIYKELLGMKSILPKEMNAELEALSFKSLEDAALFHDVGKLRVSKKLLFKKGITKRELMKLRKHPSFGKWLAKDAIGKEASSAIAAHHEKYSGEGYPKGLKASEIPLAARIISVADHYFGNVEARMYNEPMKPSEALREIIALKGKSYDPYVVDAFVKLMKKRGVEP